MKQLFLDSFVGAMNAYLALDSESKHRLKSLKDKTVTVELLPFHFTYHLHFTEKGVNATQTPPKEAHTRLKGTPLQMLGMLLDKGRRQQFFAEDILLEGDAEVGQQVIELFDELEIDWEEHLSSVTGDVPAYHIGRVMRGIGKWLQKTESSLANNIDEYLHEEVNIFPANEALQDLFLEIDALRMDVDRMEARINRLKLHFLANEDKA